MELTDIRRLAIVGVDDPNSPSRSAVADHILIIAKASHPWPLLECGVLAALPPAPC